jgi:hypothetical protein
MIDYGLVGEENKFDKFILQNPYYAFYKFNPKLKMPVKFGYKK